MPIPLDQAGRPSIKLPQIGNGVEVCIVGTDASTQQTEFGTGKPLFGDDGKPRRQMIVTGIVINHVGAMTGPQGNDRPLQVGETADIYLSGRNWSSFIDAQKAARTAGTPMQVGDVLQWWYDGDVPPLRQGGMMHKNRKSALRRARPDEQHWAQQAEALHYQLGFPAKAAAAATPSPVELDDGPFGDNGRNAQPAFAAQSPQSPQGVPQPQYGGGSPFGQQTGTQSPTQGYPSQPQPSGYPQHAPNDQPGF